MTNVTMTFNMADGSKIEMDLNEAKIIWEKLNIFFSEPKFKVFKPSYGITEIEKVNI